MRPCKACPFLRVTPTLLTYDRRREIARSLQNDEAFSCHESIDYTTDPPNMDDARWCVGALATLENQSGYGCSLNQMARIAHRLGLIDPDAIEGKDLVFRSLEEWCVLGSSFGGSEPIDGA